MAGSIPCPCNKCIPCLINRKRLWTHRIILESLTHEDSAFVTLTYDDNSLTYNCPETGSELLQPTLQPKHLQSFIKRLRRQVQPKKLRFYAVGEYGDKSWRPHYHIALFGYEPCWNGRTNKQKHSKGNSCCPPCDLLLKTWKLGGIDNAKVENDSAGYIAGYVTKKLTKKDDVRLKGRYPEFSRMSRRPGIGATAMDNIAESLFSQYGASMLTENGDVPLSLTHGQRQLPLGKYLRTKLRELVGADDIPQEITKQQYQEEMLLMYQNYLNNTEIPQNEKLGLKQFIQLQDKQKIKNIEAKYKLNKKEKTL